MRRFWWAALGFLSAFLVLLAVRMDVPARLFPAEGAAVAGREADIPDSDTWMNLTLNGHKIGYSRSVLTRRPGGGYRLQETLSMHLRVMGFSQAVRMVTDTSLTPELTLAGFDFSVTSGLLEFRARGELKEDHLLAVETGPPGSSQETRIRLTAPPRPVAPFLKAAARDMGFSPGRRLSFHLFDPASMSQLPVDIDVVGQEEILVLGRPTASTRLRLQFKGSEQIIWVDTGGDILREKGILGLEMERTTREIATRDLPFEPAGDLIELASLPAGMAIGSPRDTLLLQAELSGVDPKDLELEGGRQTFAGGVVTVRREQPLRPGEGGPDKPPEDLGRYLLPEPLVASDHPEISAAAAEATSGAETASARARRLVEWVFENIEKRPVLSVPDALTALESRAGDCNEHAVLLAALARSAGIPARIESGLVYLNGRFYYHAWNSLYVGRWVTADAVFGQMPADATHIRFAAGGPQSQLDLMALIGRLRIRVLNFEYAPGASRTEKAPR